MPFSLFSCILGVSALSDPGIITLPNVQTFPEPTLPCPYPTSQNSEAHHCATTSGMFFIFWYEHFVWIGIWVPQGVTPVTSILYLPRDVFHKKFDS